MSFSPATGTLALPLLPALLALLALVAVAGAGASSSLPSPATAKPRALETEGSHKVQKRYVAALARNGDLPFSVRREWHKKLHPAVSAHRGLQAALGAAPNAYGVPGKRYISTLARAGQLTGKRDDDQQAAFEPEKRHLGSLARNFMSPAAGKRNVGSLARGGGFSALRYLPNIPSTRSGKRGDLGPAEGNDDNLMEYEEDDVASEDDYAEEIVKRYIAALLRQGRLPVGSSAAGVGADDDMDARDEAEPLDEEKRHLGALRRLGKKTLSPLVGLTLESPVRAKRNAAFSSSEYPLPVYQPTDHGDQVTDDEAFQGMFVPGDENPEKRFLGRIPQMGRSRGRAPSPLRRGRPRSRNI